MPAKSSHFLKTEHSSFLSNGCQDKRKTPQHILCTPLDKIHKKEYATFADQYNYCCLIAQTPQNFHPRNIVSSSCAKALTLRKKLHQLLNSDFFGRIALML